jgi:hypothetical protein
MDLQGVWADVFMPAHHVAMSSFYHFLDLYRAACAQYVNADTRTHIGTLMQRLAAAAHATPVTAEEAR